MTTILFDPNSRTLYSDGQATRNGMKISNVFPKIRQSFIKGLGTCLVGVTGEMSLIEQTLQYLTGDEDSSKPSFVKCEEPGNGFEALILTPEGHLYVVNGPNFVPYLYPMQDDVLAIGSGEDIATVAMKVIHNPLIAMKTVVDLDNSSGGIILMGQFVDKNPIITDLGTADKIDTTDLERIGYLPKKHHHYCQACHNHPTPMPPAQAPAPSEPNNGVVL